MSGRNDIVARAAKALCAEADWVNKDPRSLRPAEICRLLNSTPLGVVIDSRTLRQQRERAGFRIGDGQTVDLFRYAAWLCEQRKQPVEAGDRPSRADAYEAKRERERARNQETAAAGVEIGPLPKPVDPDRKARCERDLRAFCEEYLPARFPLAWSPNHLTAIARLQAAVLDGGRFALAMPRGSGKTTLCESACLWAALYGHHKFIGLVGATGDAATEMLDSIKTEIECNPQLAADFPEVCYPVARLEGSISRQRKQTLGGERTRMNWSGKASITLPTVQGSPASGVLVRRGGIGARLRGMKHARADGTQARPTLWVIDDPQTDQSAKNPNTCKYREKIIRGTILRGGGPGDKVSAVCPCTIIQQGDLAARLLDREISPEWHGERFQFLESMPNDEAMEYWREYKQRRDDELRNGGDGSLATAWYKQRRKKMDAGGKATWPERFIADEHEISAIQHAMNIYLEEGGPEVFAAEYQNDPLEAADSRGQLDEQAIAGKCSGIPRGKVPDWATRLVAFADVQESCLWWVATAFDDAFRGQVVDYGLFPDQPLVRELKQVRQTLQHREPTAGIEGQVRSGVDGCATLLLSREFARDGGGTMRIERLLIDRGARTRVIDRACREHVNAPLITPAKGRGIGAKRKPMSEYKRRPGEKVGLGWIQKKEGSVRWLDVDTNFWKSFTAARLTAAMGDAASLSLFGRTPHRILAAHCTAEFFQAVEYEGRVVEEWTARPGSPDNHLWDCLVGCHVAASFSGCELPAIGAVGGGSPRGAKKISLREKWEAKHGRKKGT